MSIISQKGRSRMKNDMINESRQSFRKKSKHSKKKESKRNDKRKKHPVLKAVAIIMGLMVCLGLAYGIKLALKTSDIIGSSYVPISKKTEENKKIDPIKDPVSILLLGIDNNTDRQLESSRTDAMILLTISPIDKTINMVSIPRDTYTAINVPGQFIGHEKINAAYAHGEMSVPSGQSTEGPSAEASIDAVENLMGVSINYYITVDFNAFESVVDAFGGVEVDVPYDIVEQNAKGKKVVDLREGRQHLNGEEALAFSRTRKKDNDIERGNRQQEVLLSLMKQAMTVGSITKLDNVLTAMDGHFWTNLDQDTILKIGESGLKTSYAFNTYTLGWTSFDYYGGSYVSLYEDSIDYISHRMNVSLGKEVKDERDDSSYKFETNGLVSPKTFPQDGMAVIN